MILGSIEQKLSIRLAINYLKKKSIYLKIRPYIKDEVKTELIINHAVQIHRTNVQVLSSDTFN